MLLLWVPVLLLNTKVSSPHIRWGPAHCLVSFITACFLVDFLLLFLQLFVIPIKKSSEKDSLYSVCHIQMWFVLDIVFSWSFICFVIGQCLRKGKKNRKKGWRKGESEEGKKKRILKKSLNFPNLGTVDSCLAAFRGCWLASISENSWHCPVSQSLPPFIAFWNVDVTLLVPVDSDVAGCVHVNYWTV